MPIVRAHGGLSPTWTGYINDHHDVSEKNDTSILDQEIDSSHSVGKDMTNGQLVIGYWPWDYFYITVGFIISAYSFVYVILFGSGAIPWNVIYFVLSIIGLFSIVVVPLLAIQFQFYGQFIIFDQTTGLVHIPRLLRGYDTVKFEDASFIIVNRIHYGGFRSSFSWFLYRPGMDLIRDSVPEGSWRWLLELKSGMYDERAQEEWHFVVHFMNGNHQGVFDPLEFKKGKFKGLYYWEYHRYDPERLNLPDKPNWSRDNEGRWTRLKDHPWARLYWPMRLINIPATIGWIYSGFKLLGTIFTEQHIASDILYWGGIFLGFLAISFFYHVLKFDARGSKGIPLYDKDDMPVGALGIYYGWKKRLGMKVD